MLDTVNLNPPSVLKDIEEATRSIGFTMGSDHQTGSLLRTLAAAKPSGSFLELGTGTGLSVAWLLDGMDAHSRLITVDRNEGHTAIARRFLGHDSRLTFVTMDGGAFIDSMREQGRTFDFIFADMQPGKYQHLDETLQLLAPGGLYVVDDLLISSSWEEAHLTRVYRLISTLENRTDLRVTKLNWSVGLLIAAKAG
ncbi:MAG TPA: class I SAM-dependent methyltransferase [Ktedonobacteraceae bacterium]|jgi:predicted O-methyltransferase YrrM|nr:class I SAM-dependent methyltransferase [Ktedonobacteraceae bacterium]